MTTGNLESEHSTAKHIQQKLRSYEARIFKKIAAGASFTLFLDDVGELYGCGNNEDSNLGLGDDF